MNLQDYVNSATGLQLHQFKWLESDELIGDLTLEWNWLVDEPVITLNQKLIIFILQKGGCKLFLLKSMHHEECSYSETCKKHLKNRKITEMKNVKMVCINLTWVDATTEGVNCDYHMARKK